MKKFACMTLALTVSFFAFFTDAQAITFSVTCKVNAARSRVVLIANGFAPNKVYYSIVASPNPPVNYYRSITAKLASTSGAVSFVFDSYPAAIVAGVTRIPANFILNKALD
jgi:hypothetical protein